MHKLVRKDKKWNWEEEQEKTFEQLKQVFTMRLVLVTLDLNKEMRVEADVLEYAIGEVLSTKCEDKK